MRKQAQITQTSPDTSYKQLETKTNRTSFYVEIVTDTTTRNSELGDMCNAFSDAVDQLNT